MMSNKPRHGNGRRFLAGLCVFAFVVAAHVPAATAQSATAALRPKPQSPASTPTVTATRPAVVGDTAAKPAERYFVDFRSRLAQIYGHSFVAYGRITASDKITADQVAGLHPATNSGLPWYLGHLVPVPSETGASEGDTDKRYESARYRVVLNKAEYDRAVAFIKKLQATKTMWQAEIYNCNDFVADIARFMGLKVPSTMLYPKEFITGIKQLNSGTRRAAAIAPAPSTQ
jgi:hypothetical protein